MRRMLPILLLTTLPRACWGLDAVADFKMAGDGTTDNYQAFRAALADPRIVGGMEIAFPPGTYKVVLPPGVAELCRVGAGQMMRGTPGCTTIAIASAVDEFKSPFHLADDAAAGAYFEGITFRRASAWSGALFALDCGSGAAFRDCTFDGGLADPTIAPAAGFCFGVYYAAGAAGTSLRDASFSGCTFTGCAPAVGSSNQAAATVSGLFFERCRFRANYASDLEFNAPNQTLQQEQTNTVPAARAYLQGMIRVQDCSFGDNRSPGPAAWGVGLAHIYDAFVQGCTFAGYRTEAVHVEDYSQDVRVACNRFVACAAGGSIGCITVITASSGVIVSGNQFDMRAVAAPQASCVYVLAGVPTGAFPNQLPSPWPSDVTVVGNAMNLGPAALGVNVIDRCQRVSAVGNNLVGPSSRAVLGQATSSGNIVTTGK